jgi:hypothetical protein
MTARVRTLVFVVAGLTLGLVVARLRKPSIVVVAPGTSPSSKEVVPRAAGTVDRRVQHSTRPRDIPPTDRQYNPLALLQEDPDLPFKDIFEGEPRDLQFATTMEKRVRDVLDVIFAELKLDDKIRNVEIECKTLSCYTRIEVADEDVGSVYDRINGILLGDQQAPGIMRRSATEHSSAVTIYNLYRPETRDDAYYKRFLDEAMRVPLELSKKRFLKAQSGAE